MPTVAINFRASDLAFAEEMLKSVPNGARTAIRSAINDTLKGERAEMVRQIPQDLNVTAGTARDRISITRPDAYGLTGTLSVGYQAIRADDLKAKPRFAKGSGITAVGLFDKGALKFPHGFKAPFKTGHVGAVIRSGPKQAPTIKSKYFGRKITRGPRKGQLMLRQPVRSILAPAVVAVYEQFPAKLDAVAADASDRFHARLLSKVDWLLDRGNTNFPNA